MSLLKEWSACHSERSPAVGGAGVESAFVLAIPENKADSSGRPNPPTLGMTPVSSFSTSC